MTYLLSLDSDNSRYSMGCSLRRIAGMFDKCITNFDWKGLRYESVMGIKELLKQHGLGPASINRDLSAIRGVMKEFCKVGKLPESEYARIRFIKNVKLTKKLVGRILTKEEISKTLLAMPRSRDRAMLALLTMGLRRDEIAGLKVSSWMEDGNLNVVGKGDKRRIVPMIPSVYARLADWKKQHMDTRPEAPLFYRIDRHGNHRPEKHLTPNTVRNVLLKAALQAKIPSCSPHDLRRTFCTEALSKGIPIDVVAHLAGHSSVDTTRRYDRSQDGRAQRAVLQIDLL